MTIRHFLFLIVHLSLVVVSTSSQTILVVDTMPVPSIQLHHEAFVNALVTAAPGNQFEFVEFQANGNYAEALTFFERHRGESRPDLVVSFATLATQAAVSVFGPESGVPVLFAVVVDPVGAEIVQGVGVPSNTNVAGVVYTVDRSTKIETVLEVLQTASGFGGVTVGIPHSNYPSSMDDVASLHRAVEGFPQFHIISRGFEYVPVPEGIPAMREGMAEAIRRMEPEVDWWWEAVGPMSERSESVTDIRSASTRPVLLATHSDGVEDGALLSISPDPVSSANRLAGIALEIFAGGDPGTFPTEAAPGFDVAVNVGTALSHGLVVPSYLIELAGSHVYR